MRISGWPKALKAIETLLEQIKNLKSSGLIGSSEMLLNIVLSDCTRFNQFGDIYAFALAIYGDILVEKKEYKRGMVNIDQLSYPILLKYLLKQQYENALQIMRSFRKASEKSNYSADEMEIIEKQAKAGICISQFAEVKRVVNYISI
ncbi:hypothetical protein HK096_008722 [Nowakowskiella sp. JEL0078]|nr:hypothetical protein HK096_008722 [Nowakowskiella sp. JEL0078]